MQIILNWDSSVASTSVPADFKASVQAAANALGATILNPVTVTINVGVGEWSGSKYNFGTNAAIGGSINSSGPMTSAQTVSLMTAHYNAIGMTSLAAHLSDVASLGSGVQFELSSAQAKALGVQVSGTGPDGAISFNPAYLASSSTTDIQAEATQAIVHALTRPLGVVDSTSGVIDSVTNLFAYASPGKLWSASTAAGGNIGGYFSTDGGNTGMAIPESLFGGDTTGVLQNSANYLVSSDPSQIQSKQVLQADGFNVTLAPTTTTLSPGATGHVVANSTESGNVSNIVVFSGAESDYTISPMQGGSVIAVQDSVPNRDGSSSLYGIPRLQFSDGKVAFDMGATQSGGHTAEILGAAFGPSALTNKSIVGIGLKLFDHGYTMGQVAQLAINTGLVAGGSATPSNTAFVEAVWQNVVGSPIDSASLSTLTNDLANGTFTQATLLAAAAETTVNQSHIGLVGLAAHGLAYA